MASFRRGLVTCLLLGVLGCGEPTTPCEPGAGLAPAPAGAVRVVIDGDEPELALLRSDVPDYLSRLWSTPATAASQVDDAPGVVVWISGTEAARTLAGLTVPVGSYGLKRVGDGTRALLIVYASDARARVAGGYALLEALGVRFFHPMQELVPALAAPGLPATLDVVRTPLVRERGVQMHTLHPIEYMRTLLQPSETHLAEAKRLVDWLVKTGQNHLQWVLMTSVPYEAFVEHANKIAEYAHARGVTIGLNVQLLSSGSLQRSVVLVPDATDPDWQGQLERSIDALLRIPLDDLDISLGEFSESDPDQLITYMDRAVEYVATRAPTVTVNTHVHVGNYENLYLDYRGERIFYYHLAKYMDPRLGVRVHTVNFFDLYRDWGTYKHPDFFLQRDFLLEQLGQREVSYYPESAYWVTADLDVPVFLPEYIESRHLDITRLAADIAARGAPPMEGHVMFSSGHEWGYWMTDYLTARLLWEPTLSLPQLFAHYGAAYGACADDVTRDLVAFTALQSDYLFDRRLMGYLAGEDFVIDSGTILGFETHPTRVPFEEVLTMDAAARATLTTDVVDALERMSAAIDPITDAIAPRCRGADAALRPFCDELRDGYAIVALRARHAAATYRAMLALAGGDRAGATAHLDRARGLTADAAVVIAAREQGYRFTDGRLTEAADNETVYPFGALRQASVQCFWKRREAQVDTLIKLGVPAQIGDLPLCQE